MDQGAAAGVTSLCGGANLMQIAKKKLMIMAAPASLDPDSYSGESSVGLLEHAIQVLDRLIKLSTCKYPGASNVSHGLGFNHAQCRFLDLQSFHDNLRNLVDEMSSLSSVSREQCRSSAMEIAKVARNAEILISSWLETNPDQEGQSQDESWLRRAIVFAGDDGLATAQQKSEQQWCVSVLEIVLAQFRAGRDDSFKHKASKLISTGTSPSISNSQRHVPYWMIDRAFEIAEESLLAHLDRGLIQAVRLDRRSLLDKLRRLKQKHDGILFRSLSAISSKSRRSCGRIQELTSYLITKLGMDDDDVDSFVERIHENESWASSLSGKQDEESHIGTGQFGSVYRSSFLGVPAAVKVIDSHSRESFWNEVSVLASVHHPHLAQLIFADISDEESGECRLWTELLGGTLDSSLEILRVRNETPELMVSVELMLQVAEGMSFLHSRGVLHRNLNAFNVLHAGSKLRKRQRRSRRIRSELNGFVQVKITDFGLPKTKLSGYTFLQELTDDEGEADHRQSFSKPPQRLPFWQAPEAFKQAISSSSADAGFTKKSDVYSFAMLCYQILSSQRPFSELQITESLLFRLVGIQKTRPRFPRRSPHILPP